MKSTNKDDLIPQIIGVTRDSAPSPNIRGGMFPYPIAIDALASNQKKISKGKIEVCV